MLGILVVESLYLVLNYIKMLYKFVSVVYSTSLDHYHGNSFMRHIMHIGWYQSIKKLLTYLLT